MRQATHVIEDDRCRLPAHFREDMLCMVTLLRIASDTAAGADGAGETDDGDARMRDEASAAGAAEAGDYVDHARGEVDLLDHLGER